MVLDCMAGNVGKAAFIKRMLGYGVTGDVSEEIFVIFTGTGRNGKGGITQTLSRVLAGFYKAMNSGLICDRQVSNIDAERGKLLGARLAVFDELKDGEKLRTQEVQLISGGDGIPVRPLYRDPITIEPHHLCILATNHMPELSQVLAAMVQRVLVVHFPVTFVDLLPGEQPSEFRRQKDPALKARLAANPEGVLRWLVEGAVEWYAAPGLRNSAPAEVLEYSRLYFAEQDRLGVFLEERCRIGVDLKVATSELLEMYNGANKDAKMSPATMAAAMRSKGFEKRVARVHGSDPKQCFVGLEALPAKSTSSRSELAFKAELEARTGIAFEQARPDWLRNPETGAALELDMYSRERRLAVEYDGPQHYEYPNGVHRSVGEYEAQRRRDACKDARCAEMGVRLLRVRASSSVHEEVEGVLLDLRAILP